MQTERAHEVSVPQRSSLNALAKRLVGLPTPYNLRGQELKRSLYLEIDIWSAGVVLLTMLSKRFPFFNSADDVDATIEIATIFGKARMRSCALLHGAVFETNIPTIGEKGFTLEKIIMWATNRIAGGGGKEREKDELREANMSATERVACEFLARCLELDPAKRIDADEAMEHEFLRGVKTQQK